MNKEFALRREKLASILSRKNIDVALIMQNADMYYYAGTIPSGVLAISKNGKTLFAIRRGFDRAVFDATLDMEELTKIKGFSELPHLFSEHSIEYKRIGVEMDVVPADIYFRIAKVFHESEIVDISTDIRFQRSIKSDFEVSQIKEAARLLDCTMEDAKEIIKVGMREIEISARLEFRARKRGHQGRSRMRAFNGEMFMGHVHSGYRSPFPSGYQKPTAGMGMHPSYPEGASNERIEKNTPIIVDFLSNYHGYMADETRTFVVGKLDKEFERAYGFCLELMEWLEENAYPGRVAADLYQQCVEMAQKAGYGDNFMGVKGNQTTFVGHGIGLELDEFPFIAKGQNYPLKPGMTFAFEPKVSFAGKGSVGIENTYLVTENGIVSLTRYPREIVRL